MSSNQYSSILKEKYTRKRFLIVILAILAIFPIVTGSGRTYFTVMSLGLIYAGVAISWTIIGGYTNQVLLANTIFFGVGAYTSTLISSNFGLTPYLTILLGGFMAVLLSLPVGLVTFRLKGGYFALTTLALFPLMRLLFKNWTGLTQGSKGIYGIPPFEGFEFSGLEVNFAIQNFPHYYLLLVIIGILLYVLIKVKESKFGLSLHAIRGDETAAKFSGVNVRFTKQRALILTSMISGLMGAYYAHFMLFINPSSVFAASFNLVPIVMALFGGFQTVFGPFIGAMILWVLDQTVFTAILPTASDMIYGIVLVFTILFMRNGIMGFLEEHLDIKF